jgi:hypothetical protein
MLLQEAGLDVDFLSTEQFIGSALCSWQRARVMVTRSEYDHTVNDEWVSKLRGRGSIREDLAWWTTNKFNCSDPGVFSLPIGLVEYNNWHEVEAAGDCRILMSLRQARPERELSILLAFRDETHIDRVHARQVVSRLPTHVDFRCGSAYLDVKKYFEAIRKSEFTLCPRGNGIDTHRIWEAWYLGSIPIIKHDQFLECYAELPLLIINSWADLEEIDLSSVAGEIRSGTYNLSKLLTSYWLEQIDLSLDM